MTADELPLEALKELPKDIRPRSGCLPLPWQPVCHEGKPDLAARGCSCWTRCMASCQVGAISQSGVPASQDMSRMWIIHINVPGFVSIPWHAHSDHSVRPRACLHLASRGRSLPSLLKLSDSCSRQAVRKSSLLPQLCIVCRDVKRIGVVGGLEP